MEPDHNHAGHHETTDASIPALVKFGIGLFLLIVVVLIGATWMFNYFRNTQQLGPPASPFEESQAAPPGPRPSRRSGDRPRDGLLWRLRRPADHRRDGRLDGGRRGAHRVTGAIRQ